MAERKQSFQVLYRKELGELSNLVQWRLAGDDHQFTGCLPAGLAGIEDTDIDSLNLDTCVDS